MNFNRFRGRLAVLVSASAFAVLGAPAAALAADCANADALPSEISARAASSATLCLINERRAAKRAMPLRAEGTLAQAAEAHAHDMVANRYFSHTSLNGNDFITRVSSLARTSAARRWALLGENLAWGSGELATPRQIVQAWMDSRGHRANILRRGFRVIGIAVVQGTPVENAGIGATYATTFGARN